ncbi:MAG: rhomboid family intramembrane serine protease, partial [Planctomycetaceae bacterium]|nr:rhomboid family intramembrane serine protease [Planctomycetaceae bacterium]
MVLAPINTDAPIYHWPRATVGLIAANVVAFLAIGSGALGTFEDVVARYGLVHGEGLQPWQWLTSNFVHRDWLHLAGNMLFLWGLGLVVEGKIGWQRFLALYLGLGIAECATEQTALSFVRFDSYGSSAIIFGLLAIALVWAPKNDLIVAFWVPISGVGSFDVSISLFCFIVLAVQGLLAWWVGPTVLLHLMGAMLGFAVATVMVRRGLVDCEGWDLYSVLKGRTGTPAASDNYTPIQERPVTERPVADTPAPRKRVDPDRGAVLRKVKAIKRIRALLQRNQALEAYEFLRSTQHLLVDWQLPVDDHLALADALQQAQQWNEAVNLW